MARTKAKSDYRGIAKCKGWHHNWDDPSAPAWVPTPARGFFKHYWICDRCGTEKVTTTNKSTGDSRSQYYYPDRYHEEEGTRREHKLIYLKSTENHLKKLKIGG